MALFNRRKLQQNKYTATMASAARRQIIGGGTPINKSRQRRRGRRTALLRSAPRPTLVKQCCLNAREKLSGVVHWHQTLCSRETIPGRRSSHRKGAVLSDNSPRTVDQ